MIPPSHLFYAVDLNGDRRKRFDARKTTLSLWPAAIAGALAGGAAASLITVLGA